MKTHAYISRLRIALVFLAVGPIASRAPSVIAAPARPNVVLVITDDQGWGDVGFHGNPHVKTPHLDHLAGQSVELVNFYVSPVCSPTRASLMTGRYNYRTGAIDTYLGRSTMAADETTLAEMLSAAGYRTGIFGKWHLGDNYPSRPIDQGFGEALVHRGGGIGQPADPPGNHYLDPQLLHNGRPMQARGYCSDVFTDAAIRFIDENRAEPFFAYLAFNCPHTPLEVPSEYHRRYQGLGLNDETAKVYGMVANIDDNVGRLMAALDERKLADNTILIFMTDNGPQSPRFNGILRDLKGSVYDGGIRAPFLVRWPAVLTSGRKIEQAAAHIDVAPTLLDACGVERPAGVRFDGASLLSLLRDAQAPWSERTLYFQWHRGDRPELGRACAAHGPRYKLVQANGRDGLGPLKPTWELYDMADDPQERHNVIDQHSELAGRMKAEYERWFADVSATRGFPAPRIIVGTASENPVTLTRQDRRGPRAGWSGESLGDWQIDVAVAGAYDVILRMPAQKSPGLARLRVGDLDRTAPVAVGAVRVSFDALPLAAGPVRIEGSIEQRGNTVGVHYVDVLKPDVAKTAE